MLFRNIMVFPQKLNTESPYDLAIPPLSIYPRGESRDSKGLFISMLIAALFLTIVKSENNQNAHQQNT